MTMFSWKHTDTNAHVRTVVFIFGDKYIANSTVALFLLWYCTFIFPPLLCILSIHVAKNYDINLTHDLRGISNPYVTWFIISLRCNFTTSFSLSRLYEQLLATSPARFRMWYITPDRVCLWCCYGECPVKYNNNRHQFIAHQDIFQIRRM